MYVGLYIYYYIIIINAANKRQVIIREAHDALTSLFPT